MYICAELEDKHLIVSVSDVIHKQFGPGKENESKEVLIIIKGSFTIHDVYDTIHEMIDYMKVNGYPNFQVLKLLTKFHDITTDFKKNKKYSKFDLIFGYYMNIRFKNVEMKYLEKFNWFKKKKPVVTDYHNQLPEDIILDLKDICLELSEEERLDTIVMAGMSKIMIIKSGDDDHPLSFHITDLVKEVLERINRYMTSQGYTTEVVQHTYRLDVIFNKI